MSTAYTLSRVYPREVLLLEKEGEVGGLCRTITANNNRYDLGSHRIHPNSAERSLGFMRDICAPTIIKNKRSGKLRLKRSYIDYPITSIQMIAGIGLVESFLCALSLIKSWIEYNFLRRNRDGKILDYRSYLIRKAGLRGYRIFYEPYARKVWGIDPSLVSIDAVKKRISMVRPMSFLWDICAHYLKKKSGGFYYYLTGGIGSFAEALEQRLMGNNCEIAKNVSDFSLKIENDRRALNFTQSGRSNSAEFEILVSAIPLDELMKKLNLAESLQELVKEIKWRGLKLAYLHIEGQPLLDGESFYFPELKYVFGRVSIPKRFSYAMQPDDSYTVFTCEIPCSKGDRIWNMPDHKIYDLCLEGLRQARLITEKQNCIPEGNFTVNIASVYPVYTTAYQKHLSLLLKYLSDNFPYIYTSGKLGFFLHCNLDHAIEIGLSLAEHLQNGKSARDWHDKITLFQGMKLRD